MSSWPGSSLGRELRGDERKLFVKARQTLWDYDPLRASHAEIQIDVQGRRVRLTGRVRSWPQKVLAEVLLRRLDEVDVVENALVSDPEVVRAVADVLAQDERTAPYVLRVDARHGLVTLRGEVPGEAVKAAAEAVAASVPLVAAIRNEVTLGGPTYPPYALRPVARGSAAASPAVTAGEAAESAGATA